MPFNFFKRKQKEKSKRLAEGKFAKLALGKEDKETLDLPSRLAGHSQDDIARLANPRKLKQLSFRPNVLFSAHITEKATMLGEKGQYVFRVHGRATKNTIKESVESLYGVAVRNIRLIKKPAKKIRVGRRKGVKKGLRKAVVQLKKGETIEVISR